jgi:(R,R)-butanediol dehydrogenase/meso-butanediol dehydrogenase/diacetyl reductase
MAEYVAVPAYACYRIPDNVSDEAAALVEPLAVAIHSVNRGNVRPGDTVAIVGDGAIGLCALMAAKAAGAASVYFIVKHQGRGKIAASLGATEVIYLQDKDPVREVGRLTGGLGADIAIECVGQPETPQLAVNLTRRGGTTVLTGVFEKPSSLHFGSVVVEEKTLVGNSIYVHEGETAVAWLKDGRVDPRRLVTSIVPLKDAVEMGFEKLLREKESEIKILLKVP